MPSKKPILEARTTNQKTWNYNKGGVNLSFTLNIDNKTEMKDWVECLERAKEDVIIEIKKFNK